MVFGLICRCCENQMCMSSDKVKIETKSKNYTSTMNTGRTQSFTIFFMKTVLKPKNHTLCAEIFCKEINLFLHVILICQ